MNDAMCFISDTVVCLISLVFLDHAILCHFGVGGGGCWLWGNFCLICSAMVKMDSEVSHVSVYKRVGWV
jgi:hypothetical protein